MPNSASLRRGCARRARATATLATLALLATGCDRVGERLREQVRPASPHERYAAALESSGLASTALGRDWTLAAARALREAAPVALPFREVGVVTAALPDAAAWQITARRGQQLTIRVSATASQPAGKLFVDVFAPMAEELPLPTIGGATAAPANATAAAPPQRTVVSAELAAAVGTPAAAPAEQTITVDADADSVFILRVQPELLRGVRYSISVTAGPSLATFPIADRDSRAVQSFWGADRDGGVRRHEGVDIFAPRGTPVVAATDGVVMRVQETAVGGRVVWLRDEERSQSLYYAHLDQQLVAAGTRVRAGDTLGLVGNTGNARGTQPHLHFGIYRRGRGAVDPYAFIHAPSTRAASITGDTAALSADGWRRVASPRGTRLTRTPGAGAAAGDRTLAAGTALRVEGATADAYRVRLPDGMTGYVAARATEPATGTIGRVRAAGGLLRERPAATAIVVDSVGDSGPLPVLARFGAYALVRTRTGRTGWVAD